MLKINPSIFKGYDIRGVFPEEINEDIAYRIGAAFCEYLNRKKHFEVIKVDYKKVESYREFTNLVS